MFYIHILIYPQHFVDLVMDMKNRVSHHMLILGMSSFEGI